jgi:glucose 1-dehydrogenase
MRFGDKVCLVTGGAAGIGRATAAMLAAEGARVLVVDRDGERGAATAGELSAGGGDARFHVADVGLPEDVAAAVGAAVSAWGRIDVLINNAAMMTFAPIVDVAAEDWDRLMAVNLRAAFLFCKHALPHMPGGGSIVNISSVHAHRTTANVVPYAASKAALEAFTRGLSIECEQRGVRVNALVPGSVDTPMLWTNPNVQSGEEKIGGFVAKPEEVAAVICFLASQQASAINGSSLVVDGGLLRRLSGG